MDDRDPSALMRLLRQHTDLSQTALARMSGISQPLVSGIISGKTTIKHVDKNRVALEGLGAFQRLAPADMSTFTEHFPSELGLGLNGSGQQTASVLEQVTRLDLEEVPGAEAQPPYSAISSAVLSWLVSGSSSDSGKLRGEEGPEAAVRAATAAFASLDNRFGGDHARIAATQYLSGTVVPLLRRSYPSSTRHSVFAASAEFVLSLAWMSYDAQRNGTARRYFVQALDLADHAEDRLLGASVLSAMSHQANYVGSYTEARDLARAALTGAGKSATATLRAQFLMMEARAHASLRDKGACSRAMGHAEQAFNQRDPGADPAWIGYFDQAEYSDEVAHCHRDLGEARAAQRSAEQSLTASCGQEYARSRVFTQLVLASAVLGQGEVEEACHLGAAVVPQVRATSSARCAGYLDAFVDSVRAYRGQQEADRFLHQAWESTDQ
ncbi:helix-turn-helix domain-containing protein [Nocardiopsis dassonvillei]|uniref:helix-turn-helix domain-containing protein n=1 Tax=Nocardiopsis dassonvillei TaxID=2014 RepID=UPI00200BA2BE|nr:helix-turn-helix transcriptional regulator [Nocardiopsis dassonvillei]MCK9870275.1 helix-turn-helix domain-containing protein [Nocardiopsis dassonvillei]